MKEFNENNEEVNENKSDKYLVNENNFINKKKTKTINQIKNIIQQDEEKYKDKNNNFDKIQSFNDLINICNKKKEMSLKYDLETNVNLVKFENKKIEISFNENLDKNFIKILSSKLLEWTNERWIIALSKEKGNISQKELEKKKKDKIVDNLKKTAEFKKIQETFKDAIFEDFEGKL